MNPSFSSSQSQQAKSFVILVVCDIFAMQFYTYIDTLLEKRSVFQFQSAVPSLNTYEKIIGYRLLKVLDLKKTTTYTYFRFETRNCSIW